MKKIVLMALLAIPVQHLFSADTDRTFSVTIVNKSGEPLTFMSGFFNLPIEFGFDPITLENEEEIVLTQDTDNAQYGFPEGYAIRAKGTAYFRDNILPAMDGDERFEVIQKDDDSGDFWLQKEQASPTSFFWKYWL